MKIFPCTRVLYSDYYFLKIQLTEIPTVRHKKIWDPKS